MLTIFVDMDDVLADTYGKHIELYNQEHKQELSLANIESGEVWHNVPEIHKESILQHAYQDGFFRDLEPIKDSIQVMEALCNKHNVYIATAATQFPNSLKEKSDWLDEHMPFITWQHRIMCGHKFILNGDLLIDDRSYNLERFAGDTLLFNSPHNQHETDYTRVNTWLEIAEKLL
ncbi:MULTISPECIES: 5' nucleotidase, NT5C type [Winogradskyella]|uniref:5'(3')-deoxyribonucleotidase n=1 Tax=Winogradskyella marincola TaxID=3037795 RepID=A0ABT6G102_9FLAO|nr:5'(3')-deoxyribonucleotidase [Winogradskyella sp. YYF002]MDG4715723.1 5'(3')-deoxyribonucleotidase [Winogradskyella sp. YYF002]